MNGSYSTVRLQVSKQVVEMLIAEVSNDGDDTVAVPVREVFRGNCLQLGCGVWGLVQQPYVSKISLPNQVMINVMMSVMIGLSAEGKPRKK